MAINCPSGSTNSHLRLPLQFEVNLGILGIFVGDHSLFITSLKIIPSVNRPHTLAIRLVLFELSTIECPIGEYPFALYYFITVPGPHQFHASARVIVSSLAFFLAELPPP